MRVRHGIELAALASGLEYLPRAAYNAAWSVLFVVWLVLAVRDIRRAAA